MGRIMVHEKFKQLLHNMRDYFPFKTRQAHKCGGPNQRICTLTCASKLVEVMQVLPFLWINAQVQARPWTCCSGWACTKYYEFKFSSKEWWATLRCNSGTFFRHISKGSNPIQWRCCGGVVVTLPLLVVPKRWGHSKMMCHMHGCKGPGGG